MASKSTFFSTDILSCRRGRGNAVLPPPIGSGSVNGEICNEELLDCRKQACRFCQKAIETLEEMSSRFGCGVNGLDQWIGQLSVSEDAKSLLRKQERNITSLTRIKTAIESLRTEMLSGSESRLGERKSKYFVLSPNDDDSILFVSSLAYRPFDQWLGKVSLNGRDYQLVVVSCNSGENVLLTQGKAPTRVPIRRGQRGV